MWRALLIPLLTFYYSASFASDLTGTIRNYTIKEDETLYDIARRFDLGISELILANPGVDQWIPKIGSNITLPTAHIVPTVERKGIVINIAEARLYYFSSNSSIKTFPAGIGMNDKKTPIGLTKIIKKRKDPIWIPPESIRVEKPHLPIFVAPGDENPLGKYALNLETNNSFKWSRIAIHGTNMPWSVGTAASHGCIRLYPEDIEVLFNDVTVGTQVRIIYQPIKTGVINGKLYIEVHPSDKTHTNLPDIIKIHKPDGTYNLNWGAIDSAIKESNGIPVNISY